MSADWPMLLFVTVLVLVFHSCVQSLGAYADSV